MTVTIPASMAPPTDPEPVLAGMVELRCPQPVRKHGECHPGKLFGRLHGEPPTFVHPENLIEFACLDCKRELVQKNQQVRRVLHRFDFAGNLVSTLVEPL